MSWTVDFGAWPQKWEELPEQIAVTNKETGEWDFYMLTSKAMRMIRDAKDDVNWLHAELHSMEIANKKLEAENTRLRSCLEDAAENDRLTTHEFNQLKEERDKLRELLQATSYYCVNGYCEPGDGCPLLVDGRCTLADRMRELVVEVEQ